MDTAVSASPATWPQHHPLPRGAENEAGTLARRTLTTAAAPPDATTGEASGVTQTGATLQGTVNANNSSATVAFEYGLTASWHDGQCSVVTGTVDTVSAPVA